jgi:hypothetical protein
MRSGGERSVTASVGVFVVVALAAVGVAAGACSSSPGGSAANGEDSGTDTGVPGPLSNDAEDGAVDDGGDGSASDAAARPPQTYLRIAHVSPDSPAIDVCAAPHGTTAFQGPLVGQLAASLTAGTEGGTEADGGAPGIAYSQVSAYLPLAPGQYDVRIVAAGASSCASALALARPFGGGDGGSDDDAGDATAPSDASAPLDATAPIDAAAPQDAGSDGSSPSSDWTNLPVLAVNTYATLLVAGDLSPVGGDAPLDVTVLPDDAVLAGGAVVLRAINAVPSETSLDFGLGSGAAWVPLLTDVSFGGASTQGGPSEDAVDPNGYLAISPLSTGTLSARPSASDAASDTAVANDVEIDLGSIATVIAIGGKTGDPANPPALLLCTDNQPSGGLLSDCSVGQE